MAVYTDVNGHLPIPIDLKRSR